MKKQAIFLALLLGLGCSNPMWAATKAPLQPVSASLDIKVGVVLRSGDVKYIAKQHFYLIDRSFREAYNQLDSERVVSFRTFLEKNGATAPLIEWLMSDPKLAKDAEIGFSNSDFQKLLNTPNIPELNDFKIAYYLDGKCRDKAGRDWIDSGCQRFSGGYKALRETIPAYIRLSSNVTYLHYSTDLMEQVRNQFQVFGAPYIKASCLTGFDGTCTFSGLEPGTYHLTPASKIELGPNKVFWDHKIDLKPGHNAIELSNENMAQ